MREGDTGIDRTFPLIESHEPIGYGEGGRPRLRASWRTTSYYAALAGKSVMGER
jgi:hypothetical protein